jgi:hypothetical protein
MAASVLSIFLVKADEVVFDGQLKRRILVIQLLLHFWAFEGGSVYSCYKKTG